MNLQRLDWYDKSCDSRRKSHVVPQGTFSRVSAIHLVAMYCEDFQHRSARFSVPRRLMHDLFGGSLK